MKGGPVIQYSSHGKKLNIHADSTKPLWTATRLPLWGLAYLNPPNPLFKGAIRACGLSIAAWLSLPASFGPASDDALLVHINSQTYGYVYPILAQLRVTRKLLIVTTLGVFRVAKIPTLILVK